MSVTVRKIKENPKDIPLSFSTLKPKDLQNVTTDIAAELTRLVPNFHYLNLGDVSYSFYTMRGLGFRPINPNDTTVTFSYDGVPTSLLGAAITPLDVQRIEVLRGPQSVLYGRSTLGGAVNYISNPPRGVPEASTRLEIGENGYLFGEGIVGGTLIPHTLFARGAIHYDKYNGDIPNGIIGGKDGNTRVTAARASLKGVISDKTKATIHFFYEDGKRNMPSYLWSDHPNFPTSGTDRPQKADRTMNGGSLTVIHDFDSSVLTSITGISKITKDTLVDLTDSYFYSAWMPNVSPSFFANPLQDLMLYPQWETIFSQEIRLNSRPSTEHLQWVTGASYMGSRYKNMRDSTSSFNPLLNGSFSTFLGNQTYGVFGEVTAPLTSALKLTAGGRLAQELQRYHTRYTSNGFPGTVPSFNQKDHINETYLTGRTSLSYDWTKNLMSYISAARGYSSGGFQAFPLYTALGIPESPFLPATSWAYEAGVKSLVWGGRAQIAASAFLNNVHNGPIYSYDTLAGTLVVAPYDYKTQGLEFSGDLAARKWLTIHADVGYTHARFVNIPLNNQDIQNGNIVPDVPCWTLNMNFEAHHPVSLGNMNAKFFFRPEFQYVGTRSGDPQNTYTLKAYQLINMTFGFEGQTFNLYGFARNLMDKRYAVVASVIPKKATGLVIGQGRIIGVGMTARF